MKTFDRFDICEAYYVFATLWHGGMFTKEYAIFGRLEKCGAVPPSNISLDTLSENARLIYDDLVIGIGSDPYADEAQIVPDYQDH